MSASEPRWIFHYMIVTSESWGTANVFNLLNKLFQRKSILVWGCIWCQGVDIWQKTDYSYWKQGYVWICRVHLRLLSFPWSHVIVRNFRHYRKKSLAFWHTRVIVYMFCQWTLWSLSIQPCTWDRRLIIWVRGNDWKWLATCHSKFFDIHQAVAFGFDLIWYYFHQ